jgi:NTP pyrophosphatase (non-canonical NTP hydrolase)
MTNREYILDKVPVWELLAQVAEEASELTQAALKVRRTFGISNPTPLRLEETLEQFEEEIADLLLCLESLGYDLDTLRRYRGQMDGKLQRWATRLGKTSEEADADGKV